jgi:protein tyrosine phosphatase
VFGRPVDAAASAPTANTNGVKEPIKIELPEPGLGCGPIDYPSANLEPEDFRDRPPFFAAKGTTVVSRGKSVSASVKATLRGELKMLVDGDKSYEKSSEIELPEGIQWVQIDLGAKHEVYAVLLWHSWKCKPVYSGVIVQVSNDPEFQTGVITLYNNDADNKCGFGAGKEKQYLENNKGRFIDAKGITARYIRCYSNGNNIDEKNRYVEIEVFGRPAAVSEEMEPIKIELPEPFFGGTPFYGIGPNLEPEVFKDRPPFMAPRGVALVSKGTPITASVQNPIFGELKMLVDGDKNYAKSSVVELPEGKQWVQIDLQASHEIHAVLIWHAFQEKNVYFDVIVQVSDDPEFKGSTTTLYNNDTDNTCGLGVGKDKEYIENNKGRLIVAKGVTARYVRSYTNGNCIDDKNRYVEIEVFGRLVK